MFIEAATFSNPVAAPSAQSFLEAIFGVVMYMSIPVIGLALVYAGFMFITARGNREEIRTATYNITYILAAIALILGSYAIGKIVYNTIIKNILGWS